MRFDGKDAPAISGPVVDLDFSTWKPFVLSKLFDIKKGKRLTKANMVPGSTPFIGAIDGNNGLTHFIGGEPQHLANTITVNYNGNGVAEAFYQPDPYLCSDDVNVLYSLEPITTPMALFVAAVIRLEKFRFSYGRKWHLLRMRESTIHLPTRGDGTPDWDFMERYINSWQQYT